MDFALAGIVIVLIVAQHVRDARRQSQIDRLVALVVTGRVEHREQTDRLVTLAEHAQNLARQPHPDLVEHMRVIESLSQRIQAPERARWDPMPTEGPLEAPEAVDTVMDEDYWVSKEQLAEKYLEQMKANDGNN